MWENRTPSQAIHASDWYAFVKNYQTLESSADGGRGGENQAKGKYFLMFRALALSPANI